MYAGAHTHLKLSSTKKFFKGIVMFFILLLVSGD